MSLPTTIPTPTREPQVIAAGDAVVWNRQIDNFDPATWTLKYVLRSQSNIITFQASADSGMFRVDLSSTTTAAWIPGTYAIAAYLTSGSTQVQTKTYFPKIAITANLASNPQGVDAISYASKMLAITEATIAKLTSRTVLTASVNGQTYSLQNINDLFILRERWKSEVRREEEQERLNAGLGAGNKIGVRFRPLNTRGWPPYNQVPWQ